MTGEYIVKDAPADEAESTQGNWSMRHPFYVLVLLGAVCAGAMGLLALFTVV